MRIPLDYYRILSVPIKATSPQLEQAYGDRAQQQPRREYEEQTIVARLKLIEEAYRVLSDPECRHDYDARFFTNTALEQVASLSTATIPATQTDTSQQKPETEKAGITATTATLEVAQMNPTIEILPEDFVGALSIMHELGEYELVLKLGMDYLDSADYGNLQKKLKKEEQIAYRKDIILSWALAYLELGREQWHRQEYENAARSGQMGLDLLLEEGLFPSVKQELEVDLYKLRPYRILESIAKKKLDSTERAKGFKLLTEMIRQRQGIEGKGEDYSGLTFDQFLCFIQQLRTYLTSAEQEQLFTMESQENSAIAKYLATYSLLARGFALKQPELILQAQNLLQDLSQRQDVYWEQAICSLLLSNTHKAVETLRKSQDKENIELIREEDPEGEDLLPGLCFYGEKWLQEEVIAQFCDLENIQITLNEYFADFSVQSYLEQLSSETVITDFTTTKNDTRTGDRKIAMGGLLARWYKKFTAGGRAKSKVKPANHSTNNKPKSELAGVGAKNIDNATFAWERSRNDAVSPNSPIKQSAVALKTKNYNLNSRSKNKSVVQTKSKKAVATKNYKAASRQAYSTKKKRKLSRSTLITGWLFVASMILSIGGLGFVTMRLLLNLPPIMVKKEAQLTIALDKSTINIPPATPVKAVPKPKITFSDRANQVIQTWLTSKSAAFGKEYKIGELNKILAPPLLSTWRDRAVTYQQGKFYREYEHEVTVKSAKVNPQNDKQATVEAEVKEVAKHYQGGKLDNTQSYDDNLLVRYNLILQGNKWLIQNAEVLKTL